MSSSTITVPHQYSPRPYQLEYLKAKRRFSVMVWHRRSGKSKTALNEQIRKAVLTKGVYYYFLPTYRQAKAVIWDSLVREHVPPEVTEKINESELAIYYKNGSIQRFAGAEDIDKHRGINPTDVVFDEYSEHNEELWTVIIQPVLRENKGSATFIFTPKGKNHAWKLLQHAKNDSEWFWSVRGVHDTRAIDDDEIEKAKRETPQAFFNQEYLCDFLDDASAFFRRVRDNLWDGNLVPEPGHSYTLGVDLAKYQDWTVLTPFDRNTFKVGAQDRFNQIDWNLQKARIEANARKYNNALLRIDSTGVGDPVVEDLQRQALAFDDQSAFRFTETSRRQLLDNLAILLEQDKIKIPNDEGLITELESMRFSMTDKGRVRVAVPENMTDDRIMSLALAVWGEQSPIKKIKQDYKLYVSDYS